ncbi:MAG: glycosyltransferase family 2 protein [Betaproteobacteria bacterium]
MRITIITVAYNSARTIGDTLDSVAAQLHPDIEHIIVDGGSKDETLTLIATRGTHVKRVISEPDEGIYDAMNKGLRLATGEIVGFLNSDDMFASPDVLARIASAATGIGTDRPADAVYGDLVYVNSSPPNRVQRYWRSGRFTRRKLALGWMPPHPTLYVRRTLMEQIGAFDARLRISADYEFMLKLLSRPGLVVTYLPQVLVHMRVGGASNGSLGGIVRKSREDLGALRKHRVGGVVALVFKNLRKLPQFFMSLPKA